MKTKICCMISSRCMRIISHRESVSSYTRFNFVPVRQELFSTSCPLNTGRSQLRKLLDARQQQAASKASLKNPGKMQTDNAAYPSTSMVNEYASKLSQPGFTWDTRLPVSPDGPIGTHSGKFHCDEVLAVAMLKLLPEFESRPVVRSRNLEELAPCSIVMDVGGEFEPLRHRYDHHQRSFTFCMRNLQPSKPWDIKLSSSGLIYCFFGREIISQVLGWNLTGRLKDIEKIYDKVYENFMQEIDAIDNGIKQTEREQQKYQINTNLSARVGFYNPTWNSPSNPEIEMQQFEKAMQLARAEFCDRVRFYAEIWLPARATVERAVVERFDIDSSGEIIAFNDASCPWKEHLTDIECEAGAGSIKPVQLVVFYDQAGNSWRVQGVPVAPHSFDLRTALPMAWRSLRDADLQEVSGVADAGFCHANGFIGGAKSKEGAVQMARLALKMKRGDFVGIVGDSVAEQNGFNAAASTAVSDASDGASFVKRQKMGNAG